jgi:hypothetical protein
VKQEKICESAYLAARDPQKGPYMHAAAMVDRSSGTPHFYMVRGRSSDSVVNELHKQLIRAGKVKRPDGLSPPRATTSFVIGLLAVGVVTLLLGLSHA